ncbi:NAD(P)/FAD-dependent oxidoreductase [Xanthobacter aminoxidans]|uniref:FAD-dependent oxidoreductase n=1 Tax=Xanthobacter aminoxidans TaxID=186280 RepID=A0ABW6ZFM7_9HYPH
MAEIAVLGAGMVGVATALALQERGHDCVVIDRAPPGSETSYGNAGIIQAEAVEPYALPTSPLALLAMAGGARNAVNLHWPSLPGQAPALFGYWRSSLPGPLGRVIPLWRQLVSEAVPRHAALIEAAGADELIRRDGYWEVHDTEQGLAAAVREAERKGREHGVTFSVADRAGLAAAEPALRRAPAGAVHWTAPWTCLAPGGLVDAYARLFEDRGGRIVAGDARTLQRSGAGWQVAGMDAKIVVVALGPWSPELLRPLGYRVPMVRKRGYHRHYGGTHGLTRPILLADHSVVLSPMRDGLRIATAAELSAAAPAASPRQLARGEAAARSLVDLGSPVEATPWSGTRPCLPGLLPLACRARRHPGLWFHFGHGHQGFTLGPVTAERLARAIDGDAAAVDGLDRGIK